MVPPATLPPGRNPQPIPPSHKLEPQAVEAEMAVLGSLLLDPSVAAGVFEILTQEAFHEPRHRVLFESIRQIVARGGSLDLVTLKAFLIEWGNLTVVGGIEYAESLVVQVPTAAHAVEYAKIVLEAARRRKVLGAMRLYEDAVRSGVDLNGHGAEVLSVIGEYEGVEAGVARVEAAVSAKEELEIPDPPIDWVCSPVLAPEMLTVLQGKPKGGKSCFALFLAACVAHGRWPATKFDIPKPRKTLFLSWEDPKRRIKERLVHYYKGMSVGEVPEYLFIQRQTLPPPLWVNEKGGEKQLRELILRYEADFVVLDTLSKIHTADENSAGDMNKVTEILRRAAVELQAAILVVHHIRKTGQAGDLGSAQDKGRGSSAIAAAADVILDWGDQEDNHTPVHLVSKETSPLDFVVHYIPDDLDNPTEVRWELQHAEPKDDAEETYARIRGAIPKLLETSPEGVNRSLVATACGISLSAVTIYLRRLVDDRFLVVTETGRNHQKVYKLWGR